MMHWRFLPQLSGCVCFAVAGLAAAQPAPQAERQFERLNGDVYWARDFDLHLSTILVTPEGIVVADPIGREFATWLKAELAERFDVPVRYVIYSHRDYDHASGGEVFADTARFVAHENTVKHLALPPASTPLPERAAAADANGNGRIERGEARGPLANQFDLHDANGDDALDGAEITRGPLAQVRPPDITFATTKTITLGGKRVELHHVAIEHADDNTVILFPDDAAVFIVDFALVNRLPFGTLVGETDEIKAIEALPFEHFVPGHGQIGKRADLVAHRRYREELRDAVAASIATGKTKEQTVADVTMPAYASWEFYPQWLGDNVRGMYDLLTKR